MSRLEFHFESASRVVNYVWGLHFLSGLLVLIVGLEFGETPLVAKALTGIAKIGMHTFPLARSMSNCSSVGMHALAITSTMFFTGHLLIIAYIYKSYRAMFLPSAEHETPDRFIDIVFWYPLWILLGIGMYTVVYVALADSFHTVCATDPLRVWLFRIFPSLSTPFFVGMITAPLFSAARAVYRFFHV